MRTHIALAISFCLALAAGPTLAQNPSYEGRGYGGPLYVGPNFEQGGQHTPPVYGTKPAKKRAAAKPRRETPKAARKAPSKKNAIPASTEQDSTGVAPSADTTNNVTSTTTETPTSNGTTSTATTCKRFDSTAGQTITVPCQ